MTTWRRFRQVNIQRIYDLATPRKIASSVDQAPRKVRSNIQKQLQLKLIVLSYIFLVDVENL